MLLQSHDHGTSTRSPQINTNDLNIITLSAFDSSKGGAQKTYMGPITDTDWSIESPIARSILRSQSLHWSCVKGFVIDESDWQLSSIGSFCRNPFITVEYPLVISSWSDTAHLTHGYVNGFKGNKGAERKLSKAIERGDKSNDRSISRGLTEVNSKSITSKSRADCIGNIDLGVTLAPHATRLAVALPDHIGKTNQNIIINETMMPDTITFCSITIGTSKAGIPYLPQDFRSEKYFSDSGNGCQISSTEVVILNRETQGVGCRLSRYSDQYYTDINDSLVLDSVSLGTANAETCTAKPDLKLPTKEDDGNRILKSSLCSAKDDVSPSEDMLSSVVEPCNRACRKNHASQWTDRDRKSHVQGKKEKLFKKVSLVSNVNRICSLRNQNGHSGKENTHSIWQKVQKNDADECSYKDNLANTQSSNGFKQAPVHNKHHGVSNSFLLSKPEGGNRAKVKVPRKVKRKKIPGPKQEFHRHCSKESHVDDVGSNVRSNINMQQNGISNVHASRQNDLRNDSSSMSRMSSKTGSQTKKVESLSHEPIQKSETSSDDMEAYESTHAVVPILSVQIAQNHPDLTSVPCGFPDSPEVQKELAFSNGDKVKIEREMPARDHNKSNGGFEALSQKWVPVGGNNSGMPNTGQFTLPVEKPKVAEENLSSEYIGELQLASDPSFLTCPTEVSHFSQDFKYANALLSEDEIQVQKFAGNSTFVPKDSYSFAVKKCSICEFQEKSALCPESGFRNIFQAVNDAYNAQLASEALERVTGFPIAEFEKFMYSASPVIYKSKDVNSSPVSLPGQTVGASPCAHETPSLPLGSLWQWYEKHGVCGLGVRSEDHENSKRLGMDEVVSRCYFVPYLSAVQLFREYRSRPTDNRPTGAHENKSCESSSSVGLLSVFPLLVPQPCEENLNILSQRNHVSNVEPSLACMHENVDNQPEDSEFTDGLQLLFEYFEAEPPQRRLPLFEKIKELANGERPLTCRLYGDPTILESVSLNDLHPSSWFSVAWYPIYRIPDGKLHAAFLTYHSLGHLVREGPTCDSHCVDASIVSPVVGLQCYNVQGECWFRPRHSAAECKEDRVLDADPSQILKERIRTLEKTACLMARAVFRIGSETYANRQPDYEFFLSRRC